MKKVRSAGGIAIRGDTILLIKKDGKFTFAKGHIEDHETEEDAASRELLEETGYVVEPTKRLGSFTRRSEENDGEIVDKEIIMFMVNISQQDNTNLEEEPVWVNIDDAVSKMLFQEERDFLITHLDEIRTL